MSGSGDEVVQNEATGDECPNWIMIDNGRRWSQDVIGKRCYNTTRRLEKRGRIFGKLESCEIPIMARKKISC